MQGRPPTAGRAPIHTPKRWTRCTGLHSIPDRPRRADRTGGGCWSAVSVSDRALPNGQKRNELFRLFFLFKSLDKMNGNVYTIDSERKRLYTTTKQEGKTMKTTLKDIRRYVTTNAAEDLTKSVFQRLTLSAMQNADLKPSHTAPAFMVLRAYWSRATPPANCTPSLLAPLRCFRLCDRGCKV